MVTHIFISPQQNNLSNPPTPPASLPPTPPPVARQKLLNGFATTEELVSKGGVIVGHDGEWLNLVLIVNILTSSFGQ